MPDTIKIIVCDAVEQGIPGATVDLDGTQKTTGADGVVDFPTPPTKNPNTLIVTHPQFVTEKVNFYDGFTFGKFDNPLLARQVLPPSQRDSNIQLQLTIRIGRLSPVPKQRMKPPELEWYQDNIKDPVRRASWHPNQPVGAGTQVIDGFESYWSYVDMTDELEFALASQHLLKEPPEKGWRNARPWDKMNHKPTKLRVRDHGRLFLLFHGPGVEEDKDPFMTAVWSPNVQDATSANPTDTIEPLKSMDYILYYMPDTNNWRTTYPFGFYRSGIDYGQYKIVYCMQTLVEWWGFAAQLAGRKEPSFAPIIMPINKGTSDVRKEGMKLPPPPPGGAWGPYGTRGGAWRLVREVNLFLHRELRTSYMGPHVERMLHDRWAGGSLRNQAFAYKMASFGVPPKIGRVAICCHSFGGRIMTDLMAGTLDTHVANGPYVQPKNAFYWGSESLDEFNKTWQEVWDLDGKSADIESFWNIAHDWFTKDGTRIVRFWRTGELANVQGLQDLRLSKNKLWTLLLPTMNLPPTRVPTATGGPAFEMHGERWSIVWVGGQYFQYFSYPNRGRPPPPHPLPGPADKQSHEAMLGLAFSHAVALSRIGKH